MKGVRTWKESSDGVLPGKAAMAWKAAGFSLALLLCPLSQAQEAEALAPESEQVNINQADAATIAEMLDGVGLTKAEAIVSYRELNGEFASLEDLVMVSGIGEATVQRNQEKIRFD